MDYQARALALRKRIAVLGVTHGVTQGQVADRLSLHESQVSYALTGKRQQPERLEDIAAALDEIEREAEREAA